MVCIALSLCTIFPEIKSYYGQFSPQETCDTFAIVSTLNISFIQICGEHTTEILCSQNTLYRSCALFTTHFTFLMSSHSIYLSLFHWLHLSRSISNYSFGFHTAHYREVLLQRQQQSENFIKNLLMRPHSCGTLFTQWWRL